MFPNIYRARADCILDEEGELCFRSGERDFTVAELPHKISVCWEAITSVT